MKSVDFKIEMPLSDWMDQTIYTFEGPEIDGVKHRVILTIDRALENSDIERYARKKRAQIMTAMQGGEVLKSQQATIDGGNPVFDFVVKWTPAREAQRFRKYVFVIYDNRGFVFCIDFKRETYKLLNDQLKRLIEGFLPQTYVVRKPEQEAHEYHSPY